MTFAQLCSAAPAGYEALRRSIDAWDRQGKAYEFSSCQMPPSCTPALVTLGFARRANGYLLYWKPAVQYHGPSRVLAMLFSRSVWSFPDYESMAGRLLSLRNEVQTPTVRRAVPPPPEPKRTLFHHKTPDPVWPPLYTQLTEALSQSVLGQPRAVEAAAFRLYAHVGKQAPARPLSLIFHGPTGVGKSELGKAIAPALAHVCGKRYQFVWTELNTFTQPHSVHRLTGAPPGYVGYEDQPVFESVRRDPYTVFMFDELEKAHPEILKVFMSILDEGRCTAHKADEIGERELDFRRCIFLFTTNADLTASGPRRLGFSGDAAAQARPQRPKAATPAELAAQLYEENEEARRAMVRLGVLQEIAGRFTGLIGFSALDSDARLAITAKQIAALGREYGLQIVHVDPETVQALAPGPGALSIRSAASVLEGVLTPVLAQAAASGRTAFRLSGSPGALRLSPAYFSAS